MALFQQSVLKKHIETLNNTVIAQKWEKFQAHFLNATIQQNIRKSKEEQYQEGFFRDLFVTIFGYTLNPAEHFNLTTELKNITNSKKVDGAILIKGSNGSQNVVGVIELKGTDTTDLAKIEAQAFGYKTNQPGCNYVITSNFEKLRFYIDNTTQYQEFNLFTLTKDEFTVLYCCLDWESISNNLPTNLLNQSVSKENAITKQLYNDYSAFKRGLYNNLVELNPQHDRLLLFKKTQKLLDRFLFIFFAEDRLLLPTNLIRRINKEWENLQKMRIPVSLYDRYVMYFHDLNEGAKVTLPAFGKKTGEAIEETHEIFAYNGGLFKNDEFLDNLKINDQLLYEHTHKMSDYDFQSEVDVNILGHIFENSLNDIDEIKSEIEGNVVDKTKTKRKKDGVFYTPKYITKYIVDNTVGKLCTEKKEELQLIEEEYHTEKNLQTKTKKALLDKLTTYRAWLLQLTICDPACGSGAFLNQALEFLIEEHTYIDELQAKLMGDSLVLSDVENSILENNLYGVDLNDESIEIAKLSLWLRTAQKGRKLNSLNNNIKCGNSLIDDPEVAGDKAFSWENEFPEVFARGGFDVIIGNPPYGIIIDQQSQLYFTENFPLSKFKQNLYILFIERILQVFKKGIVHIIIPKSLLFNKYFNLLREELILKTELNEIYTITEKVFEDAEVGSSLLIKFTIKEKPNLNNKVKLIEANRISNFLTNIGLIENIANQDYFLTIPNKEISIVSSDSKSIINKLLKLKTIKDYYKLKNGLNPGNVKQILICDSKKSENHKQIIWGKDLTKYNINWSGDYINYDMSISDKISINDIKSKEGMNKQNKIDFALRTPELFENRKLLIRKTGDSLIGCIDENNYYFDTLVHGIYELNKTHSIDYLVCIINSNSATLFYRLLHDIKGKVFAKISLDNLSFFPIPNSSQKQREILSEKGVELLAMKTNFQKFTTRFTTYFLSQYQLEKLSGKLEKWYELSFVDFIKELNKAIKTAKGTPLTKKDEFEWMELFEDNKKNALALKAEIDKTDKEIDQMVYTLYGLTEEEIKIVEGI